MGILEVLKNKKLISHKWNEGNDLLCLYTAMVGDPSGRPGSCPARICPQWLAHMLPAMDDKGTDCGVYAGRWLDLVTRIGILAPYFGKLSWQVQWKVARIMLVHYQQNLSPLYVDVPAAINTIDEFLKTGIFPVEAWRNYLSTSSLLRKIFNSYYHEEDLTFVVYVVVAYVSDYDRLFEEIVSLLERELNVFVSNPRQE